MSAVSGDRVGRLQGRIAIVQEERFRLIDRQGRGYLLTLGTDANVGPERLRAWMRAGREVRVEYRGAADLTTGTATRIGVQHSKLKVQSSRVNVRRALRDWSLPRQLRGQDAARAAASTEHTRALRPRLEEADRVGTSICPYCAVGCAQLVYARGNQVLAIEGDPASPINAGTLCPKGAATLGLMQNPNRVTTVRYRAPYSAQWEERPLDWAIERIARLVKLTRDQTFVEQLPDGTPVNHTLGLASLGGATLDNEENYLIKKLFGGGLGMVWIENQARI